MNKNYLKQILIRKRNFDIINTTNAVVGIGKDLGANISVIYNLELDDVFLNIDNKNYYLSDDVAERLCDMCE